MKRNDVKRNIKRALTLCLAAFALSCQAGCDDAEKGEKTLEAKDMRLWRAEDTEKIRRDGEYEQRLFAENDAKIVISGVRNEYENAQIVMTPAVNVSSYTVKTADLTGENGAKFGAENFSVYNVKYIDVQKTTTTRFTAGYYPDALLPFKTAEQYGENKIAAGENQSVWFECYIPKEQKAGQYTGKFTVTADGLEIAVPVTLTVYDYTLSDEVHSKSSFGVHRYWNEGGIVSAEKDASYEMYAKYYEYLLSHRISTRYLPSAMSDIEGFVAQLRKYVREEKCSNYILPYVSKWDNELNGTCIDYSLFKQLLTAIYDASVEDGYNYFKKASTYFAMFDEITAAGDISLANAFYSKLFSLQFSLARKWHDEATDKRDFREELIVSMLNVPQLMVTTYSDKFAEQVTYCPLLDKYDTETSKSKYGGTYVIYDNKSDYTITQNAVKWWYSAGIPKNPYPSYHIDDNGYSPVVYSWMQYANGVTGNLYWSATFYLVREKENDKWVYNGLQDCYSTAMRFPSTNGDGFLLYPGAPYSIDGPVGSIRLQQIADGLEEYDMLYALEEKYNALNDSGIAADFSSVAEFYYNRLFYGTQVGTDVKTYEAMRESMISLLAAAEKGVVIASAQSAGDAFTAEVYVADGVNVSFNAETVSTEAAAGGKIYAVKTALSASAKNFTVTGADFAAYLPVGAMSAEYTGRELGDKFTAVNGTTSVTDEGVTIYYAAVTEGRHSLNFAKSLTDLITADVSSISIALQTDVACAAEVLFVGSGGVAIPVYTGALSVGTNRLNVNLSTLNRDSLGELKNVTIRFGGSGDNVARTITVTEISVKQEG